MNYQERLAELFNNASELSPEEQAVFLARECADQPTLLAELQSLLGSHAQGEADHLLHRLALNIEAREVAAESVPDERVGQVFGRYEILKLIGEGGMGEVYLAEDTELGRKVALKLIKSNLKSKEILRRFSNERQILAQLNHENIARLLDVGTSADGHSFLVMEYVDGRPIDDYCNSKQLSATEQLKLFRLVCSAVQYAHQNLVIHRDLKPGNILVSGDGRPKLLDFGIAKLLDPQNSGSGEATATLLGAMTPEYASPEQVKGEPITTATDVYSLGVLLYELLTGRSPYKLKRRTADEITRAICEQEPVKPSSAVFRELTSVASSDGAKSPTEVGTLNARNAKLLRGDLDNIVLKALRKEPQRRYVSVEQFSEDIRRHLEGLPVSAHRGSFTYRTGKFIKRNTIAVAAAALIVVTLAGGIIATTIEARRANRRFNEARQLAHRILFDYHDQIAALPGSTKVREQLVKDTLRYLDNLSKDAGNDVSLLRELAAAYEKVSAVQGGTGGLPTEGRFVSTSNLGDTKGALESIRKSITIRERLIALDPRDRRLQIELAYSHIGAASLHSLAGPPEKVLEYCNKAIPTLEAATAASPSDDEIRYVLGNAYLYKAKALGNPATANLGDMKGALEFLSKAQAILEKLAADHPTDLEDQRMVGAVYNLASSLADANGNGKQALEFEIKAIAVDQHLVDLQPLNPTSKSELAIQTGNAGSSLLAMGDTKGALEKFKQALSLYESIIAADPNDAATRRNAGVGYRNVGVAIGTDNRAEAMKNFDKALEIFAGLVAKDASNADFRRQWAYTFLALSRFQVKATDFNAAVDSAQQGIQIEEALVASAPTNVSARNTLALLYRQLGESYAALGAKGTQQSWSEARNAYQKALDIYQELKSKGTLAGADAGKPDELAKEIAKCDMILKK